MNLETLKKFRRLARALEINAPEIDDLERIEILRHKDPLRGEDVRELIQLLTEYKDVISQI